MSLPDAAAEFARQLVAALAGDTGRDERNAERELRELRDIAKTERAEREKAERQRDELLAAAHGFVTAKDGSHASDVGGMKLADVVNRIRAELRDIVKTQHEKELLLTKQRDELLAAVREYLASPGEHPRRLLQRRYDDIVAPLP